MLINELTEQECGELLARASFGRLGCSLNDQPYIVPIYFVYETGYLYALSTLGQKTEWMRKNPKVCIQVDEIMGETRWVSVIANGRYEELREPQYTEERAHARKLLERRPQWWRTAMAERQAKSPSDLIPPLLFRIQIDSMTGLRATDQDPKH
jgi:nitroimidazol reductase NimA-like FMN-containing flavoprotein (pyridoxamine 5'-phosphate oxidase superfamily)